MIYRSLALMGLEFEITEENVSFKRHGDIKTYSRSDIKEAINQITLESVRTEIRRVLVAHKYLSVTEDTSVDKKAKLGKILGLPYSQIVKKMMDGELK